MLELLFSLLSKHFLFFALHFDNKTVFPKPLSAKEERLYFERLKAGDKEAKNKLIEHNLRLVAHIVKKYYAGSQDQDDLLSIGTFGLIKAVGTFNCDKGSRFATYASRCIENEIRMHFRAQRKSAGDVHFDEPIDTDKNGNKLTLIEVIADENCIDDEVELEVASQELYRLVWEVLTPRERDLIVLRYGLCGRRPMTQRETAAKLGISRSYVSRIEKSAVEKLRDGFSG